MELGKQIAKVAVTGALLVSAMLPALAQTSYTIRQYRDPVTGNIVERRTVIGPGGRSSTFIYRHHHRYYHRRHSTTLYMVPSVTRRYYYDDNGRRYRYDSDGDRRYDRY